MTIPCVSDVGVHVPVPLCVKQTACMHAAVFFCQSVVLLTDIAVLRKCDVVVLHSDISLF